MQDVLLLGVPSNSIFVCRHGTRKTAIRGDDVISEKTLHPGLPGTRLDKVPKVDKMLRSKSLCVFI